MKAVLAWLVVSLFFVAINAVGAGVLYVVMTMLEPFKHATWPWFLAGVLAIAAAIGFAMGTIRLIGRLGRSRARAPG